MAENQSKMDKNGPNFVPPGGPQKNLGHENTHLYLIVTLKALLHLKNVLFCLFNHNYKITWNAEFDDFPSGLINPS